MTTGKKNYDKKNILLALIVVLNVDSAVQSVFLVKIHRAVEGESSSWLLEEYLGNDFGAAEDFLKRFESDKWDPFTELQSMRRQMERMFDDSHNRFKLSPFIERHENTYHFLPQTDIEDQKDRYSVKMNIPGADEAEIKGDLQDDVLTVNAQTKRAARNRGRDNFLRIERSLGSFQRSTPLPSPVDEGQMETKYEDGVLAIIIPKVG